MPFPFRYTRLSGPPGGWKGALHMHSTLSDGKTEPEALLSAYRMRGYDFAVMTDHFAASSMGGRRKDGLLVIDGIEATARHQGTNLHAVGFPVTNLSIGLFTGLRRFIEVLLPKGAFSILCHPHWSDNCASELVGLGANAIEIYNHDCQRMTGKGFALAHWDYLLARGEDVLGVAVDDTHGRAGHDTVGGAWVSVFAPKCDQRTLLTALKKGRFYSSNGPAIYGLKVRNGRLFARTSPVTLAHLIGRNGRSGPVAVNPRSAKVGESGKPEVLIEVPMPTPERLRQRMGYARFQITDERTGRSAWTNALYPPCPPRRTGRG